MDYLWRVFIFSVLVAESLGDNRAAAPRSAAMQITTQCVNCPKKTTTHHTTIQSTVHTNHTTAAPTTAQTNHTTEPSTTAHTNHTTEPSTTAHANHTTEPSTTAHGNHTTEPSTTAHGNHTTEPSTTAHANHTTEPSTTAHGNHTTEPSTTAHGNHTTEPSPTAHTNHTTALTTSAPSNHTSTPPTNHTTPHPTTPSPPSPTEYLLNGTSGVCLRIKAIFILQIKYKINDTEFSNYTIPSPPKTTTNGSCGEDTVNLTLTFPGGSLELTFDKDKKESSFYLGAVKVVTRFKDRPHRNASATLKEMVTPFGRSFTCNNANLKVADTVNVELKDVKAQAFELKGGNYGREMNCVSSHSKTVPIVVGIVLLVLIIAVVVAYLIARKVRHRAAGYQPL